MFIERDNESPSPFGGAELYLMSTFQVEFRPSERRGGGNGQSAIDISP